MTARSPRHDGARAALVALLVATGAPAALAAQGVPPTRPPADTARTRGDTIVIPAPPRDSIKVDSSRALRAEAGPGTARPRADTVKAPTARSEIPALFDAGDHYRWNRDELFASGALTLLDLLDRVPGLTGLRTGFLSQSELGAYQGDVGRVRVFLDGLEIDGLDPRASGAVDLAGIQLWSLEEVAVERSARELRVHLRTWRTQSVTPYTRVDALTGDQRLTLFRGFYGKRGRHGEVGQFGVQQFGNGDARTPGGSSLGITTRLGWARGRFSVDAYGDRVRRDRDAVTSFNGLGTNVPAERGTGTAAYVRAAYGDPDSGPWLQATAGTQRFFESSPNSQRVTVADSTGLDFADTNTSRAQYVVAGGLSLGGARVSVTDRLRAFRGRTYNDAVARAALDTRLFGVGGYAELSGLDSTSRIEVEARFRPLSFVSFSGSVSRATALQSRPIPTTTDARLEGAVRLGRGARIGGGVLVRDSAIVRPLSIFALNGPTIGDARATGAFVSVRGRLYKSIYADAYGVRWDDGGGVQRPQYEARSQLYLSTRWLSRFPSGNFGFLASVQHEYRSSTVFVDTDGNAVVAPGSRVPGVLLEIRVVSAVVSYQYRNFTRERYQLIPGLQMPTGVNVYGVRWEFFN